LLQSGYLLHHIVRYPCRVVPAPRARMTCYTYPC
jgi:hypothetical protein